MKKYLFLLVLSVFIFGCGEPAKKGDTLARINDYRITKEEFENDFKDSIFGKDDTLESRKAFLNNLINRKLILQDAGRRGLDKDKNFLKMIERFWEQSLLKLTLDNKAKELSGSAFVSDKMIEDTYKGMVKAGKTDKTYDQMYQQVKWEITKREESKGMNDWISDLRKNSCIEINGDLLKK
ncbi:MAG: SurA N-terminal domain-containing protein [Candidatus Omnitrophica bacterium]|nr:SurA N-terminal domain-containing protein [Candidatus Omnitrophota bacterium]